MSFINFFKKSRKDPEPTIRVEYVNAANNSALGHCNMPLSRLPETFAIETTLEIQNQKWSVVEAEPVAKADFLKTGQLRLVLARLASMNPQDILFSLPTISNDMGRAVGNALPNDNIFAIHEDDWRQVEFVSTRFSSEIGQEIGDIRQIWKSQKRGAGFETLHVRERIPEPLAGCSLKLGDLNEILRPKRTLEAVGFFRSPGTIPQSFAWGIDEKLILWGVTGADARVLRLCVRGFPNPGCVSEISALLAVVIERYHLCFVDWCRMAVVSNTAMFEKYFKEQIH